MADFFAKVTCTYCQEEINGVRIQCCVCADFDICLQCFVSGAEIGQHKNDHSYKFVDHCAVIIGGRGNWTGREELQLLDAVELYGFGNWDLVSEYVETRTPEEVKEEYISRYLDGNIGKATWGDIEQRRPILIDHVPEDKGPLAPAVTSKLPPLDITAEEAILLGYRPHREDFEREYNISAEQLVSQLQLDTTQDSNVEIVMKLAMVCMYTRKLRERARRKRIVRDYQLVAKFFATHRKDPNKRPCSKDQRELRDNMRVFSQFLTSGEHERLIASVEREKELRHRLSELLRYRSLGLTSQEGIIHYEQHAAFQNQQIKQKSGSSGYATFNQEEQLRNGRSEEDQSFTEKKFTWPLEEGQENNNSNNCNISNNSNFDTTPESYIRAQPMCSSLSQHEIRLCTSLNLLPAHYLILKGLIIQENLSSPQKYKKMDLDQNMSNNSVEEVVIQYLKCSGWLP